LTITVSAFFYCFEWILSPVWEIWKSLDNSLIAIFEFHWELNSTKNILNCETIIEANTSTFKCNKFTEYIRHKFTYIYSDWSKIQILDEILSLNIELGLNVRFESQLPVIN
jgi:hypothetical protein